MKLKIKWIVIGFLGAYSSAVLFSMLQQWLWPQQAVDNQTLYTNTGAFIYAIIFAPIIEETIFRNWMIPFLEKKGCSTVLSILISASLFALIHLNLWFLPYVVNGCLYGFVKVKTKDYYSSILCHSLYNLCVLLPILI